MSNIGTIVGTLIFCKAIFIPGQKEVEYMKIKRALISVSDKRGLIPFVQGLRKLDIEIISTGGTAKSLREAGIAVTDVSEITGFPEILDGRVKTLHPMVHGGLLARRDLPEHLSQIGDLGIKEIDLVIVNLYPFEETVLKKGVTLEEVIENIDIGGPSMIRSAAKNVSAVAVVINRHRYEQILAEMTKNDGGITPRTRFELMTEVFERTGAYDQAIWRFLDTVDEKAFLQAITKMEEVAAALPILY